VVVTVVVVVVVDCLPMPSSHYLMNYADDTFLLISQNSTVSDEHEMAHVTDWTKQHKMAVKLLRTVKLVFRCLTFVTNCYRAQCLMSEQLSEQSSSEFISDIISISVIIFNL